MKTHVKALLITLGLFIIIVGGYNYVASKKKDESPDAKIIEPAKIEIPKSEMIMLDGKKMTAKDLDGKVVIFNFWASWCTPCIEEVPSLISLVKADPNVMIIAVSGDQQVDDVRAFLKSFPGFNKPPIYIVQENAKALMEHFAVNKLPESFIFNSKGTMVKKITGTINWHTSESVQYFRSLR